MYMKVLRKNIPRPVISTNQQNRFDYIFLIILLLYLFVFLGTIQSKASQARKTSIRVKVVLMEHGSIDRVGNINDKNTTVA
jgi:hypothetical protein